MLNKIVQVYNPRLKRWVKIDKLNAIIMSHKKSKGPYKNILKVGKYPKEEDE